MKQIDDRHLPTTKFRRELEDEVLRMARGEAPPIRGSRAGVARAWLRTAAVVLVSIGFGVAAGAGSAQVREGQQRDRLLEVHEAELRLQALRVELARAQAERTRREAAVGTAARERLAAAEAEVRAMEANLARTRLDMAEVAASSRPARHDLAAPLVDGRDFVRERLELELGLAQHRLSRAEEALAFVRERVRYGALREEALAGAQMDVEMARAEMERLAARRHIREEYLRERLPADEVARRVERMDLAVQARLLEHRRALIETRMAEIQQRVRVGTADEIDLLRVRLEEAELSNEIAALQSHLRVLQQR